MKNFFYKIISLGTVAALSAILCACGNITDTEEQKNETGAIAEKHWAGDEDGDEVAYLVAYIDCDTEHWAGDEDGDSSDYVCIIYSLFTNEDDTVDTLATEDEETNVSDEEDGYISTTESTSSTASSSNKSTSSNSNSSSESVSSSASSSNKSTTGNTSNGSNNTTEAENTTEHVHVYDLSTTTDRNEGTITYWYTCETCGYEYSETVACTHDIQEVWEWYLVEETYTYLICDCGETFDTGDSDSNSAKARIHKYKHSDHTLTSYTETLSSGYEYIHIMDQCSICYYVQTVYTN